MRTTLALLLLVALQATSVRAEAQRAPSLDVKIGQMIMVGFRGTTLARAPDLVRDLDAERIGGVVLFDYDVPTRTSGRNITSPEQLRSLTSELQQKARTPLFIAIDQEGGTVNRLKAKYGFPETPSAASLGRLDNTDSTFHAAARTAETLQTAGVNLDFAPVVDLNINPDNPVIGGLERSFSADPRIVTAQAAETIRGLHARNIIATIKHFPGHGSSTTDTHKDFTDITRTWKTIELEPYRSLIRDGYEDFVMTAHVFNAKLDPRYPATLSHSIVTELLRDSLGFRGPVISDDMQMQAITALYELKTAIRLAIDAGVDILLFANNSAYDPHIARKAASIIRELVSEGAVTQGRIDSSYRRIMQLKQRRLTRASS
ncbi:glycoside hydrolase family 3 [Prosthecochloris sp. GSB1]|uniref:glycoside hydrolase family 3 protein n=1 Tax=Prosthecochloris sp. GSB1 TaxID=281093 RepID=UPI000B8C9274|nr:glycoside hydrolase family 3 protein [Prosthecochloris sp. GSB1]ASQ91432.1 glycoside hydrolase family 3 [Prosthecochloris sp. GSB1]